MQLAAKYIFSLWIQFVATLSVCGSVTAQHVLFLDTRGLGSAKSLESARVCACVQEEGRQMGDHECIKTTCCWMRRPVSVGYYCIYTVLKRHVWVLNWNAEVSQCLDTDVITFDKFWALLLTYKRHCLQVLLRKSSVSIVTDAETLKPPGHKLHIYNLFWPPKIYSVLLHDCKCSMICWCPTELFLKRFWVETTAIFDHTHRHTHKQTDAQMYTPGSPLRPLRPRFPGGPATEKNIMHIFSNLIVLLFV